MSEMSRGLLKGLKQVAEVYGRQDKKKQSFLAKIFWTVYLSDMFDHIHKPISSIRGFITNCKRVLEYLPYVWAHRNWDHAYVYKLQKKLYEDLYKGCYVNGNHQYTKTQARRVKAVIGVLGRLGADEYCEWQYDYLDKTYGEFSDFIDFSDFKRAKCRNNPALELAHRKDIDRIRELQKYLRKQDLELLHKYLIKYGESWWD
jgi:hypothetical protein